MLPYQNYLFDLDGTLTDPSEGITKCYQYALEKLGEKPADPERVHRLIGPPLRIGFASLLDDPTKERVEEAVRLYRERYATTGIFEARLTPRVHDTLDKLRSAGKTLFVVTSKTEHFAEQTLEHFGIDHFFDGVFGGDMSGTLDDKADIVHNCVTSNAIEPSESIMIGDRLHDFHAAKAHGIAMIGVRCGFAQPDELEALGCVTIINDISELLSAKLNSL